MPSWADWLGVLKRPVPPTTGGTSAPCTIRVSARKPFAVSNLCRHLFASLGKGHVTEDGCLQCPWHTALYDVGTDKMVRGPQGAVQAGGGRVMVTTGARSLRTFPVELRDSAIWLVG